MSRSLTIRNPTAAEMRHVSNVWSATENLHQCRRADVILLYGAGLNGHEIATALGVHVNTIYRDLQAFAHQGLACLHSGGPVGAPPRLSAEQAAEIRRVAEIPPYEVGLPDGRWSLSQ